MATEPNKKEEQEEKLEDFSFDDTGSTDDFFGIEGTSLDAGDPKPKDKEDEEETEEEEEQDDPKGGEQEEEEEEDDDKKKPEKDDKNEKDFTFGTGSEDPDNEVDKDSPLNEENHYAMIFNKMKERGLVNGDLEEGEELDEDKFFELQDQEIEGRVDEALQGFMSELDDDGAAFLKFKKAGGNTSDFLKAYAEASNRPQGDLSDESYQEQVSRFYYKNIENLEDEDIEDRIEWLKDSGKLEKYAGKHDEKVKDAEQAKKQEIQEEAKRIEKQKDQQRKQFVDTINKTIENIDEIDNFVFAKDDASKLRSYITKPTVKSEDGKNYMTGMQSKLQEVLKDPKSILKLAKVLESDFDMEALGKASVTKSTKEVKKNVRRAKNTNRPSGSGRTKKTRTLADVFN